MNSLIACFLAVLITVGGQTRAKDKRIMGGSPVSIKDYPYQVAIVMDNRLLCNGAIIDEHYILAVGSCFLNMKKNAEYEARSGKSIWSSKGFPIKFSVNDITFHPEGIALIHGNKSFLSGQRPTKAIKLSSKNPDYLVGEVARVSGWGICNNCGGVLIPGQLRSAEIQIRTRKFCWPYFNKLPIDDRFICGGVEGKQVGVFNKGSSPGIGSPLVIGDNLVGLFFLSTTYFYPGDPGMYLNVAMFKSWIEKKMRNEKVI